ncbi:MAG: SPOR domain-containing protein [Deltaproteobacteria bacterium]|nr:SPOR domain-containing protein [Deltaproteobacteria bacterium]
MQRPGLIPLLAFFLLSCLFSCSALPTLNDEKTSPVDPARANGDPGVVVVLPFQNLTSEANLGNIVRKSFYSHFTTKNYRDIELNDVDRALDVLQGTSANPWKDLPATALGKFFHADFLIYGKVLEYTKVFAGIYSQIALKVEVEMVDAGTGEGFWWKTVIQRSHEGGVPFSLLGIIPDALRAGFHMQKERTLDLIERVSRELVEAIPDAPPSRVSTFFLDVQVASFLEEESALKTRQELQEKGYAARVEPSRIGDRTWHRVLLGPYPTAAEAGKVKASISEDPKFKPILIHHHLKTEKKGTSAEDVRRDR